MAYICLDEVYNKVLEDKIAEIDNQIAKLEYEKDSCRKEKSTLWKEVFSLNHSESVELIDKFINDTNFQGEFRGKFMYDRYFHWDDGKNEWNIEGRGKGVYYREVQLRYKELMESMND